jgi:site-specific DNA-methyltransferase (adenine-specific)
MKDNSIDSIVTDPPYGLGKEPDIVEVMKSWIETGYHKIQGSGFMGKEWDSFVPQPIVWKEIYRVLKPGGHILCFSGTRTVDWMGMSLRFAGFEIRDTLAWIYGSGFPKSLNIGKAIDVIQGNEREVLGNNGTRPIQTREENIITKGNTEWEGWGTALKPALEPIILARKPISEKTIAENVLRWGTGGINIDDCRIDYSNNDDSRIGKEYKHNAKAGLEIGNHKNNKDGQEQLLHNPEGRFPANVLHDGSEEVIQNFPYSKSSGGSGQATKQKSGYKNNGIQFSGYKQGYEADGLGGYRDEGSASRFFYCAKASQEERIMGLYDNNEKQNFHPTVKPLKLMRYLCKLITPKNGVILDPFMGSGTTGMSAILENFNFIGIEKEKEYFELSNQRIKYVKDNKEKFDFYEEKKEKNIIKKIKQKDLNVVDFIF